VGNRMSPKLGEEKKRRAYYSLLPAVERKKKGKEEKFAQSYRARRWRKRKGKGKKRARAIPSWEGEKRGKKPR